MTVNRFDLTVDRLVIGPDWPFSLGYSLYIVSNHKSFRAKVRVTNKRMKQVMHDMPHAEGRFVYFPESLVDVIMIDGRGSGAVRLVELITHEVSHYVDRVIERAAISTVDTEVRAYIHDWVVGKILHKSKLA